MHILATGTATLDDLIEPIDLRQQPADMLVLSFTDSDLSALAAAWHGCSGDMPSLRLANLRALRHPMSVDLWIDNVARHAKVVLVRVLGGYDWWRYGCDMLTALARRHDIRLALLPGECRERDERLAALSTLPQHELDAMLSCFREGGPENMQRLLDRLSHHAGCGEPPSPAVPLPRAGCYLPGRGSVTLEAALQDRADDAPAVPILFYRSMLLAADVAPIDALCETLRAHGMLPLPIFVSSLKDESALSVVEDVCAKTEPALLISTTAFAAGEAARSLFRRIGVPVLQALVATTRREAWQGGDRGLAPADLAMHVVLPEIDGRVLAGALSFKAEAAPEEALGFRGQVNRPEPRRIAMVARRAAALIALGKKSPAQRCVAILMPDYPGAGGRSGYAVGLDVPESVLSMLRDLKDAGYRVEDVPDTAKALMRRIEGGGDGPRPDAYADFFSRLPSQTKARVGDAWGSPPDGGATQQCFRFRAARFGNVLVALAPDRGRSQDRRADYHDPSLPPRHELLAFGFWLREELGCDALVHVGAHGTLEWLPGKAVAVSDECFPEIVTGPLPVIYPFIVSNPGEAAQAKRRIAAVTIGHLPPPLTGAGLSPEQQKLERLVDEYAQADGLDRRRRDRLAELIVKSATETGLARDAGLDAAGDPGDVLVGIDAWLCDLKDFSIKDGLHVYGRAGADDPTRALSAEAERSALLAALDGRHVVAGPAGAPARGRLDVLPTGRNLYAADPRTMPTPTAFDLGKAAADEVLRRFLQDHGDWPRALVIDLWGSASLRTGGEEIAQGLALMGCRPQWDQTTGRVVAIEVLPPATIGRPRVDVTFRISGLFRDMFSAQIALVDATVAAVAARDEAAGDNPLAEAARKEDSRPRRIFGTSPGTYGAGMEELLASGRWESRAEIGRAFLAATSHAYGGAEGAGEALPGAFAARVGEAELLVHTGDDPGRDMLEGSADVAFIGGFAAAVEAIGASADLIALDTTDPARPRARSVSEAITRTVRARAVNPRFIEGQLRHGPRGAAEFAETVDRLVGFAETTGVVSGQLIETVHDAYLGDPRVRAFLLDQNPAAARSIAERLADARRRGLWQPLRNSIDNDLAELIVEARRQEVAA